MNCMVMNTSRGISHNAFVSCFTLSIKGAATRGAFAPKANECATRTVSSALRESPKDDVELPKGIKVLANNELEVRDTPFVVSADISPWAARN